VPNAESTAKIESILGTASAPISPYGQGATYRLEQVEKT